MRSATVAMHDFSTGIGSGLRLPFSVYGKLNRTTCKPRAQKSDASASIPRSSIRPPAPCARMTAGRVPFAVAASKLAVTSPIRIGRITQPVAEEVEREDHDDHRHDGQHQPGIQ